MARRDDRCRHRCHADLVAGLRVGVELMLPKGCDAAAVMKFPALCQFVVAGEVQAADGCACRNARQLFERFGDRQRVLR